MTTMRPGSPPISIRAPSTAATASATSSTDCAPDHVDVVDFGHLGPPFPYRRGRTSPVPSTESHHAPRSAVEWHRRPVHRTDQTTSPRRAARRSRWAWSSGGRGCLDIGTVGARGHQGQRRADRALVAAYHEARLGELIECVAAEVDRFRAGEVDAYAVDEALHHYHLAAKQLWTFCWSGSAPRSSSPRVRWNG